MNNVAINDQSTNVAVTGSTVASVTNQPPQPLVTPTSSRRSSISGRLPVTCMHCNDTNDYFLTTDPARHIVSCSKCKKETESTMYTPKQFVDACLYAKQTSKSGSNTFKKHTESMYVQTCKNQKMNLNFLKFGQRNLKFKQRRLMHEAAW